MFYFSIVCPRVHNYLYCVALLPPLGRSQFVPGSASSGLSTSDGEVTRQWDDSSNNSMSRSANPNLPARNEGNVVSMKTGDGQKLIAVTAYASDMLVVSGINQEAVLKVLALC